MSSSTFQSYAYRHEFKSIIAALSSAVTLTGNIYFTDNIIMMDDSSGTAIYTSRNHSA